MGGLVMKRKALASLVVMGLMFLLKVACAEAQLAPNPVPQISQPLVPMSTEPGGPEFVLTVNGTGFVPDSVVNWNGDPRPTRFMSSRQLSAEILASDIATDGTAWVNVVNPTPGGGTSNLAFFHVTNPTSSVVMRRLDANSDTFADFENLSSAQSVICQDFNGDKHLDLAITNLNDGLISMVLVVLGNGYGTFQRAIGCPTGPRPVRVTAGDFNGDGQVDLAVGFPRGVSILLGNGDATFQAHVDSANLGIGNIAVADFNGDGDLDLVTTRVRNLSVLLGNGNTTFQPGLNMPVEFGPNSPTTGDFNRDGRQDLAATHILINRISVLLGNGDGIFAPAAEYATGSGPISSIATDYNGDGILDLATANRDCEGALCVGGPPSTFSILLGNGDGSFRKLPDYTAGTAHSLTTGDFNADGRPDLAADTHASPDVRLLIALGNGDGTFQPPIYFEASPGAVSVVAGDFNEDGRLDVVTVDHGPANTRSTVSVFLQVSPLLHVGIDIKPGDAANTINLRSGGIVSVAILGSATFDPLTVDPETVTLAGAHVATRGRGVPMTSARDVNRDGYPDLLLLLPHPRPRTHARLDRSRPLRHHLLRPAHPRR